MSGEGADLSQRVGFSPEVHDSCASSLIHPPTPYTSGEALSELSLEAEKHAQFAPGVSEPDGRDYGPSTPYPSNGDLHALLPRTATGGSSLAPAPAPAPSTRGRTLGLARLKERTSSQSSDAEQAMPLPGVRGLAPAELFEGARRLVATGCGCGWFHVRQMRAMSVRFS